MATYYVDHTLGDDTDTGLTGHAWQHCPGTVGVTGTGWVTLTADDIVLFKGGETWAHSILVDATTFDSGTSGHVVTLKSGNLSSYGTGRAVIDGGASSHSTSGVGKGIYISQRNYIRVEGFEIRNMPNVSDSSGIYLGGNTPPSYCEIVNNLIHDIHGAAGASGYGIEISGGSVPADCGNIIEYNEIYYVEEKAIETYRIGGNIIRYNHCHHTGDHCMVISSNNNQVYGNLLRLSGHRWCDSCTPLSSPYGMKCDSGATVPADGNKIWNNLIIGAGNGIGLVNASSNEIHHNTVFYGCQAISTTGGKSGSAFAIEDDGTGGSAPASNVIQNNAFYYRKLYSTTSPLVFYRTNIGNDNTFSKNILYQDAEHLDLFDNYEAGRAPAAHVYQNLATFEGAAGFSSVGEGNVASGNVVAAPSFAGGTGDTLWTNCPTALSATGVPNQQGLSLTAATTTGETLAATYDDDILGVARVNWDRGAYEYTTLAPHSVYYIANGAVSGTVPVDGSTYAASASVTVLGNTGALKQTYYAFKCWNTQADGGGTDYYPGATLSMPGENLTLYAIWVTAYVVM